MACPFFMPVTRLDQNGWIHAPRLPLGDPCAGVCHARPEELFEPPEPSVQDLCNCGYAEGRCERFPATSAADAVRFSVVSADADTVRLVYILERRHEPVEHGTLTYAIRQAGFVDTPPTAILGAQARAFVTSHLDRRALATAASGSGSDG